jgi:hypothetical protein
MNLRIPKSRVAYHFLCARMRSEELREQMARQRQKVLEGSPRPIPANICDASTSLSSRFTGKHSHLRLTWRFVAGYIVGECAHFCGKGHGSMTLQIDVVE